MKKKDEPKIWIAAMVFMALMMISIFAVLAIGVVSATTWYVEEGESIQAAVDTANDGDTIIVRDGIYTENVDVNKRLTIRSESGSANCIVNASNPNDHIFEVTADYVNISGFTVENATGNGKAGIYLGTGVDYCNISDNNASNNDYGIYLRSSSNNNTLTSNTASNNSYGIYLKFSSNNNTLTNNTASNSYRGIVLDSSSNNTLTNNTAYSNNNYGIYLYSSSNNNLTSNTAYSNNNDGIYLYSSSNNNLTSNTASNNYHGIMLGSSSNNNTLTNNTASGNNDGILLEYSSNNNLTSNTMSGNAYNFYLRGSDDSQFNNTIDMTNSVDGKPIYYIKDNSSGIVIDNSTSNAGTIYCIRCDNVTIKDLNLTKNGHGVFFWQTTNSRIENVNTLNNDYGIYLGSSSNNNLTSNTANNYIGIVLDTSSNNNLTNNTANNNHAGINLYLSSNNNLTNNTASGNDYGIVLSFSSNNKIYLNNFINNADNVYSYDSTSIWNSTEKITYTYNESTYINYLGNYWSDYTDVDANDDGIWDNPRSIDSDWDYHPLMEPFENYPAPTENIFDTGAPSNPYPSIMGNLTGTIKPKHTVIATKLYTYSCIGTGGHTEYAEIRNETWNATATWKGYVGDWHNITFDKTVVLLANETYDYTIRTGSYPQIHHNTSLLTANGWINCSQFVDANGKIYYDWIPAIKLFW